MHQYELMVILDPEIDERTVAPSLDKFLNVIRNDGGTIDKVDVWGKRRLAYEINKKTEGIYAVVSLTSNGDATKELDRQLKLSEAVMRTKMLRAEEAIAQVAEAAKLSAEKAARKAAAPSKAPAAAPAAAAKSADVAVAPPAAKPASAAKLAAAVPAAPAAPVAEDAPVAEAVPAAASADTPAGN
jgi:small subunit ribosomal protein S6